MVPDPANPGKLRTVGDVDLICAVKDQKDGRGIADAFVKFVEVARMKQLSRLARLRLSPNGA